MNARRLKAFKLKLKLDYLKSTFPFHEWEPRLSSSHQIQQMVSKLYTEVEASEHLQQIHTQTEHFAHAFRVVQSRSQDGYRILCQLSLLKTQQEMERQELERSSLKGQSSLA